MKALRTAATVIGVAVAIAAAIPTGGGSTLLAGALGVSAGTASAIAAGVSLATMAFATLTAPKVSSATSGSPEQFALGASP